VLTRWLDHSQPSNGARLPAAALDIVPRAAVMNRTCSTTGRQQSNLQNRPSVSSTTMLTVMKVPRDTQGPGITDLSFLFVVVKEGPNLLF
jgi:hypothetical protein